MHKNCLIEFSIYCICVIDLSTHHAVTPNMFKKKKLESRCFNTTI